MEKEIKELKNKYLKQLEMWNTLRDDLEVILGGFEGLPSTRNCVDVIDTYKFVLKKMESLENGKRSVFWDEEVNEWEIY